jgi:hypothetical protein
VVHNNTFVVRGEHRIYEPNGELRGDSAGRQLPVQPTGRRT